MAKVFNLASPVKITEISSKSSFSLQIRNYFINKYLLYSLPSGYDIQNLRYFITNKALLESFLTNINRVITGLSYGYYLELISVGVGYRFERALQFSNTLTLNLGYSHYILLDIPKSVSFRISKNYLFLFSYDFQVLKKLGFQIRSFRSPDPYKGKGIRFLKETVTLKVGKQRIR